jgi:mRNA interferase HigB
MRVLGKPKLDELTTQHADSRGSVQAWLKEVEKASWTTPQEIKDRYRPASFLANNVVVFNIKGNRYRIVAKLAYNMGTVKIEFAGTHQEYTRLYS